MIVIEEYVCSKCFNQLNNCLCDNKNKLIQIDINMQYAIRKLNENGYKTLYCCESHIGICYNIYIMFDKNYIFDSLPDGFKYIKSRKILEHLIKSKNRKNQETFDKEKFIYLNKLNEWVEKTFVKRD